MNTFLLIPAIKVRKIVQSLLPFIILLYMNTSLVVVTFSKLLVCQASEEFVFYLSLSQSLKCMVWYSNLNCNKAKLSS